MLIPKVVIRLKRRLAQSSILALALAAAAAPVSAHVPRVCPDMRCGPPVTGHALGSIPIMFPDRIATEQQIQTGHFSVVRVTDAGATLDNGTFVPLRRDDIVRLGLRAGSRVDVEAAGSRGFSLRDLDVRRPEFGTGTVSRFDDRSIDVRMGSGRVQTFRLSPEQMRHLMAFRLRRGAKLKIGPSNVPGRYLIQVQ